MDGLRDALEAYRKREALPEPEREELLARIEGSIADGVDAELAGEMRTAPKRSLRRDPFVRLAAVALLAAAAILVFRNWDRWTASEREEAVEQPVQAGYQGKAEARGGEASRREQTTVTPRAESKLVERVEPVAPEDPPPPMPTKRKPPIKAEAPTPANTGLRREIALMQRARGAVKAGATDRALSILATHKREFADGQMAQDREALRVRALCDAGRLDEAGRAARAFLKRYPGSPHAATVKKVCEKP